MQFQSEKGFKAKPLHTSSFSHLVLKAGVGDDLTSNCGKGWVEFDGNEFGARGQQSSDPNGGVAAVCAELQSRAGVHLRQHRIQYEPFRENTNQRITEETNQWGG